MVITNKNQIMTEEELANELKDSVVILSTSSPDKRDIYRELFSSHAKDEDHNAGLNLFFTDSGALGIATRKTPEQTGKYKNNLLEKSMQQLALLQDQTIQQNIRLKLNHGSPNNFDPKQVNIIGMTEDSGWEVQFNDQKLQKQFIEKIIEKIKPELREKDYWLIDKIHKTSFPGPNLKPIQEHLEGGFHRLMEIIYDTAEELDIKELRFKQSVNVSFVSPNSGKIFIKNFESHGKLINRQGYEQNLLYTKTGEAINSNFVQIPDDQKDGKERTINRLLKKGLHSKSSEELPADYTRRTITEYLQNLIGKRRSSKEERKRHVNIAFTSPEGNEKAPANIALPNDYTITSVPENNKLMHDTNITMFGDADVIVLTPQKIDKKDNHLYSDPNYGLLLKFIVTVVTDPESMSVPIILDNRSGRFDNALKLVTDAYAQGRLMGDRTFYVANSDKELEEQLKLIKDIKQRAPVIKKINTPDVIANNNNLEKIPSDGTFTLFIGGGHANNSKRDLEDAQKFGYLCAQENWRIVTGAGSIEGSMGGIHTGFIQYHLDQLQHNTNSNLKTYKSKLNKFLDKDGRYDAEEIILKKPELLEELANRNYIPKDMFWGYSMSPLLEMESPSGKQPPAITYFDAGNMIRRLDALLSPGTKVFLPGSIGTDEELEKTIKQHLEAKRLKLETNSANNNIFTDGTADNEGKIIIYNRNGHLDKLLSNYELSGNDPLTKARRQRYNVTIVNDLEELKNTSMETASKWTDRINFPKENAPTSRQKY